MSNTPRPGHRPERERAALGRFTLIEILVVLVILGALLAVVIYALTGDRAGAEASSGAGATAVVGLAW